jgi:hypothetical protein
MINAAANMTVSIAGSLDKPGSGLVKASVVSGPDRAGAFLLRLDGGREVSVQIAGDSVKLTPGQNVLLNPADGKIFMPDAAQAQQMRQQQAAQMPLPVLAGESAQAQQPAQTVAGAAPPPGGRQEHIRDSFESPFLRSIPVSVWEQALSGRGGGRADIETLKALDGILQNRSIPIDPASAAQMERLGQWLRVVLDNPRLVEDLAARIPLYSARNVAEMMEMIGRISAAALPKEVLVKVLPEMFFMTADKVAGSSSNAINIGSASNVFNASNIVNASNAVSVNNVVSASNAVNTNNTANTLLEALGRSTFSAAPAALLDLAGRIDSSSAVSGPQLPQSEARRIVSEVVSTLPGQISQKAEVLHDAKQLSPQILRTDIAQQPQAQTSVVPQIRAEFSALTESAIRLLLGGDNRSAAAAVSENINALRELIGRISAVDGTVSVGAADKRQNVPAVHTAAVESTTPAINNPPVADKSHAAGKPAVGTAPPAESVPPAVGKSPALTGEIRANVPVDDRLRPIAAERVPTADKSPAPTNEPRPDSSAKPVDALAIRESCLRVVDGLKVVADGIFRNLTRGGELDTAEKIRLLGAVRDTISTLDTALRPLARGERPVPPEFYDRVTSSPRHQVSADSKNAVFAQIGTAQELIRGVIDVIRANPVPADKSGPGIVNTAVQQSYGDRSGNIVMPPQQPSAVNNAPSGGGAPSFASASESGFLQMAERLWANTEKIRAGFQEAFSSLDLPNRVSPHSFGGMVSDVIAQSVDALRTEMLLDVSRALREVFSSVEELRDTAAKLSDGLRLPPEAERALLRAAESLEHQARQSGAEVMDRLKDVLRELNRLQADVSKGQEQGDAGVRHSPADLIRSAAVTAARGLESLLLLANQTRGLDVQQQVLALPAKIGDEWTEVHIKFVKDRRKGGGKKEGGGHVSVYLNVAPSKLGPVTAHLDYHPPAGLKVSCRFDKPEATRWFREQAGELREALSRAGLPGTALEFHTRRKTSATREKAVVSTAESADGGGADANVVGRDGKVDFKV